MFTASSIDEVSLQVVRTHFEPAPLHFADLSIPVHITKLARELVLNEPAHAERAVFFLDGSDRLLAYSMLDPSDSVAVIGREALRIAVVQGADSIVLCSLRRCGEGVVPQGMDYALTREVFRAGSVLGVPLFDHVIVDADEYYSFRELGWLERDRLAL